MWLAKRGKGMSLKILKVFVIIPVILFCGLNVFATTYYVAQNDTNASDSNTGTSESLPWKTLKKATQNSSIVAGDTVIVKAGRYIDDTASSSSMAAFNPRNSGNSGNPITFKSEPALAAVIVSKNNNTPAFGINFNSYIVLDGFKIEGGAGFREGNHNTIKNCEVIDGCLLWADASLHWGIWVQNANNSLIANNYVHGMKTDLGNKDNHNSGCIMVFASSNVVVSNNTVDGNNRYRKGFVTKASYIDNTTWRNNFAKNCSDAYHAIGGSDRDVVGWKYHNNIALNSDNAFYLERHGTGYQIYNNTAYGVDNFIRVDSTHTDSLELWNNISVSQNIGLISYGGYDEGSVSFNNLISYSDHNHIASVYNYVATREVQPVQYVSLSNFCAGESFDCNSIADDTSGLANPGGQAATDYKRVSYEQYGRGGAHANVIGAYTTGQETIGYSDGNVVGDPDDIKSPNNVRIVSITP
jgi:hypothetical protein